MRLRLADPAWAAQVKRELERAGFDRHAVAAVVDGYRAGRQVDFDALGISRAAVLQVLEPDRWS